MPVVADLSARELAAQLRDPAGPSGLAVAEALDAANRDGNAGVVAALGLAAGDQVLEVGCGLATMADAIVGAADDIRYTGLDQSETMIASAAHRHADLVGRELAAFHVARVEAMPFSDGRFDKVFSVGVLHFWDDPVGALTEMRRVMRPGALSVMAGLGPERAPAFATLAHGFHLRDADAWAAIGREAGLSGVEVVTLNPQAGPQAIVLTARA